MNTTTPSVTSPAGQPGVSGRRVLLIDDEPALREVTQRLLERIHCSVVPAADPRDALDILRRESSQAFDLVLTDYRLPEMSGLEVAREVHAAAPAMPVVLMTGNSGDCGAASALRAAGVCGVLSKPFSLRELAAAVSSALDPAPPA